MEIVTIVTPSPVFAVDAEHATGLSRRDIEAAIRTERRISLYEPVSWPRDPYAVARAIVDSELCADYRIDYGSRSDRRDELGPVSRLSAALSEARRRRADANADVIAASQREAATIVANARTDAFAAAIGEQARREHGAGNAVLSVPALRLRSAGA